MYTVGAAVEAVTDDVLEAVVARLQASASNDSPPLSPTQRIDRIALLERLKSVCEAAQAAETAALVAARVADLPKPTRERVAKVRRGVAAEVALARRVSPSRGAVLTGLATVLQQEMPCLRHAFLAGRMGERQALLIAAETAMLSLEHRQQVDAELAVRLGSMSDRDAAEAARRIGYRLDAEQAVKRTRKAENDRRVTVRPAPDTMVYLTALLPVVQGVAAYAALTRHAATATALGDPRGRGQLMADQLVACVTDPGAVTAPAPTASTGDTADVTAATAEGETDLAAATITATTIAAPTAAPTTAPPTAASVKTGCATVPAGVNLDIQLVMTDRTLLDGDDEPAILTGYGPIPAPLARHLVRTSDAKTKTFLRRLYTDPRTGHLTGGDVRRRLFPATAKQFLIARDQKCRTPWCDAPIRDADHAIPHARGGPTDLINGNGRCRNCNLTKEEPGWQNAIDAGGAVLISTPTGHRYRSDPPPAPRSTPWSIGRAGGYVRSGWFRLAV